MCVHVKRVLLHDQSAQRPTFLRKSATVQARPVLTTSFSPFVSKNSSNPRTAPLEEWNILTWTPDWPLPSTPPELLQLRKLLSTRLRNMAQSGTAEQQPGLLSLVKVTGPVQVQGSEVPAEEAKRSIFTTFVGPLGLQARFHKIPPFL
jgi:hypothetical protein